MRPPFLLRAWPGDPPPPQEKLGVQGVLQPVCQCTRVNTNKSYYVRDVRACQDSSSPALRVDALQSSDLPNSGALRIKPGRPIPPILFGRRCLPRPHLLFDTVYRYLCTPYQVRRVVPDTRRLYVPGK